MSELLNIWREIGSYNRFAETKNSLFLALVLALGSLAAQQPANHIVSKIIFSADATIVTIAIFLAGFLCLLSFIPILKYPTVLMLGGVAQISNPNPYFFDHIARYNTSDAWLAGLEIQFGSVAEEARAKQLAQQIWIVARIATRKFFLLRAAMIVLLSGWCLAWLWVVAKWLLIK
jgi:hypothetical protein